MIPGMAGMPDGTEEQPRRPKCWSGDLRYSHNRSWWDELLLSVFALEVFRCRKCHVRFRARTEWPACACGRSGFARGAAGGDAGGSMLRYAMRPYAAIWLAAGVVPLGYAMYCVLF